jgi:hypothetical protein
MPRNQGKPDPNLILGRNVKVNSHKESKPRNDMLNDRELIAEPSSWCDRWDDQPCQYCASCYALLSERVCLQLHHGIIVLVPLGELESSVYKDG